jgi:hypothetical protein
MFCAKTGKMLSHKSLKLNIFSEHLHTDNSYKYHKLIRIEKTADHILNTIYFIYGRFQTNFVLLKWIIITQKISSNRLRRNYRAFLFLTSLSLLSSNNDQRMCKSNSSFFFWFSIFHINDWQQSDHYAYILKITDHSDVTEIITRLVNVRMCEIVVLLNTCAREKETNI